jgi:hypothetical protein
MVAVVHGLNPGEPPGGKLPQLINIFKGDDLVIGLGNACEPDRNKQNSKDDHGNTSAHKYL